MQTTKIKPCPYCRGEIGVWVLDMSDKDVEDIPVNLVCYRCQKPAMAHETPRKPRPRKAAVKEL